MLSVLLTVPGTRGPRPWSDGTVLARAVQRGRQGRLWCPRPVLERQLGSVPPATSGHLVSFLIRKVGLTLKSHWTVRTIK